MCAGGERIENSESTMVPSSAAMQREASNFLMENLLQSKAPPGTDFSLTLNLATSLVACQREKAAEYLRFERDMMMLSNGESGNGDQRQHHQVQQDFENSGRASVESSAGGGQLDVSGDGHGQQIVAGHASGRTCGNGRDDGSAPFDERMQLKRFSSTGEIYLRHMVVNRIDIMRSFERSDNRSNSAAESANSMDELDQGSGGDQETGPAPDADRQESIVTGNGEMRSSNCWIPNSIDGRFSDFPHGKTTGHDNTTNEENHQGVQQHTGRSMKIHVMRSDDNRIAAEETCTCGEEQCNCSGECNGRRIQEKEKPELKFGVRRILAIDHNMRRNNGNESCLIGFGRWV